MLIQTVRKGVGLGMALALGAGLADAREAAKTRVAVRVAVYDDAGLGGETVVRAEDTASRLFERAGIEVHWFNCGGAEQFSENPSACREALYPTKLQLRIARHSRNLKPSTFGIAYLSEKGQGCYSEIFVEPIEELRKGFPVSLATLLGYTAAHELAHLLLGSNSHSAWGIMRARWEPEDLVKVERSALHFSEAENRAMRKQLEAGWVQEERAALVAAMPTGR